MLNQIMKVYTSHFNVFLKKFSLISFLDIVIIFLSALLFNLENTSADNMPRLNNLDVEEVEVDVKPDNESLYIPEIKRLK